MELNEKNIIKICEKFNKSFRHPCSSFLTDISKLVHSVNFLNSDVADFYVQTPTFDLFDCHNVAVVKLYLDNCSCEFRRKLRYKVGHAFEQIFYLDYLTLYPDRITFFSTEFF